ncbi:MAG TPA: aldo/keto reductase [Vicinamibacteria bacterium]|nr:aldo/keto reductase [Vicinamibacteria bacterium]
MASPHLVPGVRLPPLIYGTAWKEDRTEELTRAALSAGFRGIDTANQRRHYAEAAVGQAVSALVAQGTLAREDLFLQTKFTSVDGQDRRLPYDPSADLSTQVEQSFASSLDHLRTSYVDSYVLHGPRSRRGLTGDDWEVWRAMEALHDAGRARLIGVSNVSLEQLAAFHEKSRVKPALVQNRCFAVTGWDRDVRLFCRGHDIAYQGFSLLTANARELGSAAVRRAAQRTGRTPAQVVFRFALEVGMIPLTGTSRPAHMRQDLECLDFTLEPGEVRAIEECGTGGAG